MMVGATTLKRRLLSASTTRYAAPYGHFAPRNLFREWTVFDRSSIRSCSSSAFPSGSIWRAPIVLGEPCDDRDIRLDGALGVAPKLEVLGQSLAECRHLILSGKGRRGSDHLLRTRSTARGGSLQNPTSIRRRRIEFNAQV